MLRFLRGWISPPELTTLYLSGSVKQEDSEQVTKAEMCLLIACMLFFYRMAGPEKWQTKKSVNLRKKTLPTNYLHLHLQSFGRGKEAYFWRFPPNQGRCKGMTEAKDAQRWESRNNPEAELLIWDINLWVQLLRPPIPCWYNSDADTTARQMHLRWEEMA